MQDDNNKWSTKKTVQESQICRAQGDSDKHSSDKGAKLNMCTRIPDRTNSQKSLWKCPTKWSTQPGTTGAKNPTLAWTWKRNILFLRVPLLWEKRWGLAVLYTNVWWWSWNYVPIKWIKSKHINTHHSLVYTLSLASLDYTLSLASSTTHPINLPLNNSTTQPPPAKTLTKFTTQHIKTNDKEQQWLNSKQNLSNQHLDHQQN